MTDAPKFGTADLDEFHARLDDLKAALAVPTQVGAFEAYTDGACLRNPSGPGGWGSLVSASDNPEASWELWGHLSSTSNNRAEALALLAAIEWVPQGSSLHLWSDSEYAVNVLAGRYKAKANVDVWTEIKRRVADRRLKVTPEWVRGHAGLAGNERADRLAVLGANNGDIERAAAMRQPGTMRTARPATAPKALPTELAGIAPRGAWETEFVGSIARQLKAGKALSEKQRAVLDRLRSRTTPAE